MLIRDVIGLTNLRQ